MSRFYVSSYSGESIARIIDVASVLFRQVFFEVTIVLLSFVCKSASSHHLSDERFKRDIEPVLEIVRPSQTQTWS